MSRPSTKFRTEETRQKSSPSILATPSLAKITTPAADEAYARKRLFGLLDRSRRCRAVWIWGPPGSGKTTLVASYLKIRNLAATWYHLDESDADPASFFYYLRLAALKLLGRKCRPLPLLTPEYFRGLRTFARRYFQQLCSSLKPPFVLAFDDYQQLAADSVLHELFKCGLDEIPSGGRAIVMSRQPPPPSLARLRASQDLLLIGWEDLQLDLKETAGFVRLRQAKLTAETVRRLHEETKGWAAGLTLMLEQHNASKGAPKTIEEGSREAIFDYFAGEVYEQADGNTQDFLVKTALLPWITAPMAQKLTGQARAGSILESLSRQRYFTEKRTERETVYRYHPLFHNFLSRKVQDLFTDEERATLQRNAAALLAEGGHEQEAVHLMHAAGDHANLVRLILNAAPRLAAEGRSQMLAEWLKSLPPDVVNSNPWLSYWLGICRIATRPEEGLPYFEKAYQACKAQDDRAGTLLAWSGAVDAITVSWGDFHRLDRWITDLEDLFREPLEYPTREIEEQVISSMLAALVYRQPQHPSTSRWADRALSVFHTTQNVSLRVKTGANLLSYYLWTGNKPKCAALVSSLAPSSDSSKDESPVFTILTKVMLAMQAANFTKNTEEAIALVHEGLKIAAETGVHVLNPLLIAQKMYAALFAGNVAMAAESHEQMSAALPGSQILHIGHYHYLAGWEAMLRGDRSAAVEHAQSTLEFSTTAGSPLPMGVSHHAMATVLYEQGQVARAARHLAKAHSIARGMKSQLLKYMCFLFDAQLAFDRGDERSGKMHLTKGLRIGRENGYYWMAWCRPSVMAYLCVKALESGIEVNHVRELVRVRKLVADNPPLQLENWPWPVKIFTLGAFSIATYDAPVQFARKVQRRPLDLLKVLISLGGENVAEERISDILWPDTDGDAAHRAFDTTLHRLRKLIGFEEALILRAGQLSLDRRYCWIDAWAFEKFCDQVENSRRLADDRKAKELSRRAAQLYRGPFLNASDAEEGWARALRERLHQKFIQIRRRLEDQPIHPVPYAHAPRIQTPSE